MSYLSALKSIPDGLRQPQGIALAISVSAHGLVALSLPLVSSPEQALPDRQQRVQVVELTPEQQSRLPQLNVGQIPLDGLSISPVPDFSNSRSPLLNPGSRLRTNPLRRNPYPLRSTLPYGLPFTPYWVGPIDPGRQTTSTQRQTIQPGPSKPDTQIGVRPSGDLFPNMQLSKPTNPNSNPSDSQSDGSATSSTSGNGQSGTSETPDSTGLPSLEQQLAQRQQQFGYDATGTSAEDATQQLEKWIAANPPENQGSEPSSAPWRELELVPPYPFTACAGKLSGQAVIAVITDAEGAIVGNVELIQSSGYKVLNQAAQEAVYAYGFEATGQPERYLISLRFDYQKADCQADTGRQPSSS